MSANRAFFMLLLLSALALTGLVAIFIKTVPMLLTHVVYVCQKTFSNIIFTFSHSGPLLLIILMAISLLIGILTLTAQILKTGRYLKKNLNRKILMPVALRSITQQLNLDGRINVVKDNNKFSFCYGLLQPKIFLSTGLLRNLTENELKAVLLHESYHLKNRDPLKIILSQTASLMFFFIPILKDFQNFHAFSKEIAADKLVIKNGYKQSLVSTLSKLLIAGSPKFSGVAALGNLDDLEKRILYLTDNQKGSVFRPSVFSISLSAFIVLFSMVLVNTPVYAVRADDSCKAKEEVNYSKDVIHTPANYTPK